MTTAWVQKNEWQQEPPISPYVSSKCLAGDTGCQSWIILDLQFKRRSEARELRRHGILEMGRFVYWAAILVIVAVVASLLGFGGVAGTAMSGAQILFWIAVVLFVASALIGIGRRRQ